MKVTQKPVDTRINMGSSNGGNEESGRKVELGKGSGMLKHRLRHVRSSEEEQKKACKCELDHLIGNAYHVESKEEVKAKLRQYDPEVIEEYLNQLRAENQETLQNEEVQNLLAIMQQEVQKQKGLEATRGLTKKDMTWIKGSEEFICGMFVWNGGKYSMKVAAFGHLLSNVIVAVVGPLIQNIVYTNTTGSGTPSTSSSASNGLWWLGLVGYVGWIIGAAIGLWMDYRESKEHDLENMGVRAKATDHALRVHEDSRAKDQKELAHLKQNFAL